MSSNDRIVRVSNDRGLASVYLLPARDAEGRPFQKATIERAAKSAAPVLIHGETGTGKEQLARLLHEWSPKKDEPFVAVDCGTLDGEGRNVSDLFGWEKGSFSGADRDNPGYLGEAKNGTVFLDEIANMDAETQRKLLRFLQSGEYRPLGCSSPKRSAARIVAATNKKIADSIASREDAVQQDVAARFAKRFHLPRLRDRGEDVFRLMLMPGFIDRDVFGWIMPGSLLALALKEWPDNVRELHRLLQEASDSEDEPSSCGVLKIQHSVEPDTQAIYARRSEVCLDWAARRASEEGLSEEQRLRRQNSRRLLIHLADAWACPHEAVSLEYLQRVLSRGCSDYALLQIPSVNRPGSMSMVVAGEEPMGLTLACLNSEPFGSMLDVIREYAEALQYGFYGALEPKGVTDRHPLLAGAGADDFDADSEFANRRISRDADEHPLYNSAKNCPGIERRQSWSDFGCPRPIPVPRTTVSRKWSHAIIGYVRRLRADGKTPQSIADTLGSVIMPCQVKDLLRTHGETYPEDLPPSKGGRPRTEENPAPADSSAAG